MNRREFFKRLPNMLLENAKEEKGLKNIIKLPYFLDEKAYLCKECEGFCQSVCEEKIIQRTEEGFPYIEFKTSGCTFCRVCIKACKYGVLQEDAEDKIFVSVSIIPEKCFAWNKTICFSCSDVCLDTAVEFKGLFNPEILSYKCSGCGFCYVKCPASAIELKPLEVKNG